ncbi:uncharacterized protein LOC127737472 [Mytilus californianus]|uniref:uncharacterized protein LOC127737472 n=1 Tax=Mytilus californianus TaxID=6549 RepID=UPI002248247E|nr:uncharacterized protein LOC127737472 [Mytilus californianus]
MTNKSPRSQNGKRPRLKLLDLNFSDNVNEVLSNGRRPHGGLRGIKKHPLSPYSFNKDDQHHQQIKDSVERQTDEDFVERYGSPGWVAEANREVSHSGENPLYINRLLSPCKHDNDSSFTGSRAVTPTPSGRLSNTPKRGGSLYYRQTIPHQYLSATDLPVVSSTDPMPILGRPTRTTLLRARQRCNSAPINAYQKRRDVPIKLPCGNHGNQTLSREPSTISLSVEGESNHAFLTGARYNRARLMDVKSFNVYGVYMPRSNPLECFMSGPAMSRLRNEESPGAPPDTPRSDDDETTDEKETKQKRPATAPSKRLLSSSTPSGGRPRSARVDSIGPSINIMQDESENKENIAVNNNLVEKLIFLQNGLFITGKGVIVTLKGFKSPPPQKKETILPSVTGVSVPTMKYKKSRNIPDDSSIINQPPPTPVGQLSVKDETENLQSPIPEETTDHAQDMTQKCNKDTDQSDTQTKNLEMSVKIIQLTSDPKETAVVYDKVENGDTSASAAIHQTVSPEENNESSLEGQKVTGEAKPKSTEVREVVKGISGNSITIAETHDVNTSDNIENQVKSTTFITEKEETTEVKHVLTIPNAKLEPE